MIYSHLTDAELASIPLPRELIWTNGGWEARTGADMQTADFIPTEVTMRQAQRALLDAGLLDAVEAAINALPEPPRRAALIDWTKSSALRRDSQFLAVLAPGLGLDAAALDALFVAASKVPV